MHPLWLSIVSSVCGAGRFNRSHRYKSLQALVDFLSSAPFLKMSYPGFNETFTATLILWAIVGCSGGRECKLVSKLTCYSICWIFPLHSRNSSPSVWIAPVLMTRRPRRDFWEDLSWPTALCSPRDRPPHPPPDVLPLNCPHLDQPAHLFASSSYLFSRKGV